MAVVLAALAVAVVARPGSGGPARRPGGEPDPGTAGTVTVDVAAAGTVQAAGTRGLGFGTDGTVTSVAVRAGDTVTGGQLLAATAIGRAR